MLKVENAAVYGWEAAIRGMRNPKNSWAKSDSAVINGHDFFVGDNDLKLMKTLAAAGTDHGKFLRMITVTLDIVAPLYWWSEYDTYKVGTVANSCSKMHKLLHKPFEMSDFSFDKLPGYRNEIKQFRPEIDVETEIWRKNDYDYDVSNQGRVKHGSRVLSGSVHSDNVSHTCINDIINDKYKYAETVNAFEEIARPLVDTLNELRDSYFTCENEVEQKQIWYSILQLLPESYNQRRTVMLNYAVLKNIYHARKTHKLDCWRTFCDWIESLPYSELITGKAVQ